MLKKFLKRLLIVFIVSVFLIVGFLAYTINLMINRPQLLQPRQLEDPGFTEFSAINENGHRIFACFYQGQPDQGVVVICHGHGVNHGYENDMVAFLRKAGVGIIMFDFRAHGKSEGKLCTVGLHEWNDVKAVLAAAKEKGFVNDDTPIAGFGRSMGAATLINGATQLPQIKAFVLESSFERLRKIAARDAKHNLGLPDTRLTDFAFRIIEKITGASYSGNNPVENIAGIGKRPTLLIHDELDHRANQEAFDALRQAFPSAQTYIARQAGHVQAHRVHPEEFERIFLIFLKNSGIIKSS